MAWVSCILTCSYSLSHPCFFVTIVTHVGTSIGVNRGSIRRWPSFLNNTNPNLIPENPTAHRVQIYSNQKEINHISHSNIRASVATRSPKLHNLLQFSPPLPSLELDLPPSFASFFDTSIYSCNYNNYFFLCDPVFFVNDLRIALSREIIKLSYQCTAKLCMV